MKKLFVILAILSTLLVNAQLGSLPPFTVQVEKVITNNPLPGVHSFAFAQQGSKWLIIGGRINGMHGTNSNSSFPAEFSNNTVIVIDTANWMTYSTSLSNLPKPIADPLRSTNMQYYQDGNYLYMIGGYGRDSVQNKFVTFPVLTSIKVDSTILAVVNGTPINTFIQQLVDTNLKVCGGELQKLNGKFHLMYGHNFNGRYTDPGTPLFTQKYTEEIRSFTINQTQNSLSISNYTVLNDTNNFHRRDLNVIPFINPDNGSQALMSYSGVFRKDKNLPFLEPISFDGTQKNMYSYQQIMNQYTCANLPIYDSISHTMHTLFFGGMSMNDYNQNTSTLTLDTLVPFVDDISCFTIEPNFVMHESIMTTSLPSLLGSNAKLIINNNIAAYSNGVLKLNSIQNKTLVGYLFGGIKSDAPNNPPNSIANDTLYRIYITPLTNQNVAEIKSIKTYSVSPNPVSETSVISFQLKSAQAFTLKLFDSNGKDLGVLEKGYSQGEKINLKRLPLGKGIYFLQLEVKDQSERIKLIIDK